MLPQRYASWLNSANIRDLFAEPLLQGGGGDVFGDDGAGGVQEVDAGGGGEVVFGVEVAARPVGAQVTPPAAAGGDADG